MVDKLKTRLLKDSMHENIVERLEAREREYVQTPDKEEREDLVMKPENDEDEEPEVAIPEVPPVNLAPDLADEVDERVDEVEERVDEVAEIAKPPVRVERRYAMRNVRGIVNNAWMIDTRSQEERGSALLARINEGRTHRDILDGLRRR
jgi:hypothetical protein